MQDGKYTGPGTVGNRLFEPLTSRQKFAEFMLTAYLPTFMLLLCIIMRICQELSSLEIVTPE